MTTASARALPALTVYEQNRRRFTAAQLQPYQGQWVAFSLDGQRIVAAAPDLIQLDERLRMLGETISNVGLEQIVFDDFQGSQAAVG